jgi:hypothetical protein
MGERASVTPRCLKREEAARYVGVSPTTFDAMIRAEQMPEGFLYPGRAIKRWDVKLLDIYVELAMGEQKVLEPQW